MSWLLKQAENILNRVDQQTNAVFHQPTCDMSKNDDQIEFNFDVTEPMVTTLNKASANMNRIVELPRKKRTVDVDLTDYLNSSNSVDSRENSDSLYRPFTTSKSDKSNIRASSSSFLPNSHDHNSQVRH
jgi:hypothetical protein